MKKEVKVSKLKKKLWTVFSKYIRVRDKNRCISCGKYVEGSGYHCGHFVSASICPPSLRFDEKNNNGQCYHCNINLSGNWPNYYEAMVNLHGEKVVKELMARRSQSEKWYPADYEREIAKYKQKLMDEFDIKI